MTINITHIYLAGVIITAILRHKESKKEMRKVLDNYRFYPALSDKSKYTASLDATFSSLGKDLIWPIYWIRRWVKK